MKLKAYALFDDKAVQYHPPFFAATDGAALRSFRDLANDHNTSVGRHPSDYRLYFVGEWDDAKGIFHPVSPIAHVADAIALVHPEPSRLPFDPQVIAGKATNNG